MTNYEQSAKDILQWCGGTDNVAGVSHCATRLRIAVNSGAKVNKEELEKVPGVMGIVERYRVPAGHRYRCEQNVWRVRQTGQL